MSKKIVNIVIISRIISSKSITECNIFLLSKGKPMRQGQTSSKRPTDADRHCLAAVQNFTQVAVSHSSFTFLHFFDTIYCAALRSREKNTGFGLESLVSEKKSRFRCRKIWYPKKVTLSVSVKILVSSFSESRGASVGSHGTISLVDESSDDS